MNDQWKHLNKMQLGKYAEYLCKMDFTRAGLDVYTAEVDNKGIDFVLRKNSEKYYDIQVKSIRRVGSGNYIFVQKDKFKLRDNLLLALIIFEENHPPQFLLIPSLEWQSGVQSAFKDRNYEGKKSKPEWGLDITKGNIDELKNKFDFWSQVTALNLLP